jgi:hypothetical protein
LDDHIASCRQFPNDGESLRSRYIERDRALAPVARLKEGRNAVDGNADPSGKVSKAWALDLNDIGSLISEQRCGIGPGERRRYIENPNSV